MPVTEKSLLTAELRLDVQEFYARYAECLDGGRLQQWPEFFVDSCTYRVTTRRNLRLGPDEHLVSLSTRSTLRDRIVAIGQSEDYEPHTQRHTISNFRVQAASDEELRTSRSCALSRRSARSFSSRAATTTASRSPAAACTSGKSCACSIRTFLPTR